MKEVESTDEPTTRLNRIGDAALDGASAHPEFQDGDKIILMLSDGTLGGIAMRGYEEAAEALADILDHAAAVFAAAGMDFQWFTMPNGPNQG